MADVADTVVRKPTAAPGDGISDFFTQPELFNPVFHDKVAPYASALLLTSSSVLTTAPFERDLSDGELSEGGDREMPGDANWYEEALAPAGPPRLLRSPQSFEKPMSSDSRLEYSACAR